MAQPVYKFWQVRRTEAWYQLSQDEQQRLGAQVDEALARVGGKRVVMGFSAWSNEQWLAFGVEEFPDIQAAQQHAQLLTDLNWYRYIESTSTLGTAYEREA